MTLEMQPLRLSDSETSEAGLFQAEGRAADKQRQKVVAWALNSYQESKQDRSKQERQWYLNLAFYFGQQYARFRGTNWNNFDMYTPTAPYYRSRPVINYVRRTIRKDIARLTSQKPNAYVVPASSEDRDMFAAQAGEQVWDSLYNRHNIKKIVRDSVFWASVCGNGFIKQYWDAEKEDKDNPGQKGEVCYSAESPFHLFVPDLLPQDIEDQPWVMHANIVHPEFVKRYYGLDVMPSTAHADLIDESFLTVMGANQISKDRLLLVEMHVKPGATSLLPEGGYFTLAGTSVIHGGEGLAYDHGMYPFSKIDSIPTGKFYNDSVILDMIPSQRELNRTVGQVVEAKNRMSKPQLVAEEGSVDATKITTEPGQVIFYRNGFNPPTPLPLQTIPPYVLEQIDREISFMSDLSGQHEVSKGQVPPGVTAATAISYLQEQDESILSTVYDSIEEAMEKTAKQSLYYVKQYWDTERLVKVTGTDGTFDALMLKGSKIADDIRMEGGSALPTSRAAKQAFITDLMTRGFIDPEEGLSVMEMGGLNKIYDRIQIDIKQVQRENIKLSAVTEEQIQEHIANWQQRVEAEDPQTIDQDTELPDLETGGVYHPTLEPPTIIPVNSYDNHQMHIEYHNRYRKSQSFEMAPDHVKAAFEAHVNEHEELLMGEMPEQIMGANPLEPAGPGMGEQAAPGSPEQSFGPEGGEQPGPEPMPEPTEVP